MTEWNVPAEVMRVVDGDTLDLLLDLGWGVTYRAKYCRLIGIDTPELSTPEGRNVRAYVMGLCPVGTVVRFHSKELDKWRRPLGSVELRDGRDLGTALLELGYAVPMRG